MTFRDHFSAQAALYAACRPTYPPALFAWLASLAPRHDLAWDCGTGSGQAAVALAEHFDRVEATDASAAQLAHAVAHPRVTYRVAPAEASGLASGSAALVTVAQALHWFELEAFYAEVRRVLAPDGVLAVWTYGHAEVGDAAMDAELHALAHDTLGPYWPPERRLVDELYRTIPFPFREVAPPALALEHDWTLAELAGYLRSWSATLRWQAAHGTDPVAPVEAALRPRWGGPEVRRRVRWPLAVRAGVRAAEG